LVSAGLSPPGAFYLIVLKMKKNYLCCMKKRKEMEKFLSLKTEVVVGGGNRGSKTLG